MKSLNTYRNSYANDKILRFIIYFISLIWWLKTGILTGNDTVGYWGMTPFRSPGYPVFIKITTLFGLIHSHYPTLFIALVLQFIAIHKFVDFLKVRFDLAKFSIVAVTSVFILPDFILSIANADITECIAYPLFLTALHLLLKAAFDKNEKAAFSYFIVGALLILVRSQFLFLYGISILLIIYLLWFSKTKIISGLRLTGFFVLSIIIVPFCDRTYHLVANHSFSPTQFTGVQLIVPALFNMQPKDTLLFKDPTEKGLVDTVLKAYKNNELYNCKFNSGDAPENMVFRFSHLYILLQYRTTLHYLANIMAKRGMKPEDMSYWANIDNITTDIALKLIKAHPKEYITLYFNLFKSVMGYMLILGLFVLLFLYSIVALFVYGNNLSIFLFIACLLTILNSGLISILALPLSRYLFYTFYLLFAVGLMVITKSIEDGHKEKTKINQ